MDNKLDIKAFLDKDEQKDLLRLLTAGSVDDGKSTLIGRLLFDSKKLYEDQLDALERDSKRVGNAGEHIDYALLLDGLKAEREQGITIDVAYRYFSTNARVHKGESIRVFPISNWTELDIWQYIRLENIPIVPLYYAKERPVINLDGNIIMADDDRLPEKYRDQIEMKMVRFRTLGCWPLTGAVESGAATIEEIVEEMMTTTKSERTTRVIDFDQEGSMEQKKREGYF